MSKVVATSRTRPRGRGTVQPTPPSKQHHLRASRCQEARRQRLGPRQPLFKSS
jgi:hypothetical protein